MIDTYICIKVIQSLICSFGALTWLAQTKDLFSSNAAEL